jgi:hypothetical protein
MARKRNGDGALARAVLGVGIVLSVALADSRVFAQTGGCDADFAPGHVLVRFKETVTAGAQQTAHLAAGALLVLREYHAVPRLQLVQVLPGLEQAAIASYANDSSVEYAEPDYLVRFDAAPNDADYVAVPSKLWGLNNTGQTGCIPFPVALLNNCS